ncbi:hypothetical protein [Lacipirellula parvula]|uniref:Uncharacterized protein n=1 Tax=Lacipirellula parvula TaxID=2650471 RepID=A0A5K7XAD6_9BACT|nr:hypothetical protein [Lacipirellula parvula]BBO33680.1 hypothetical protein PLANPX_3292 [Lacipirellula parvula]
MNTYKGLILSAVFGSMLASSAMAGQVIGTEKARGHFGGGGWTQLHEGRHHVNRGYTVARQSAQPVVVQSAISAAPAAPAPAAVAQAPAEGRRFSYAPTPQATASSQPATAVPSIERSTTVQPTYSSGRYHRAHVDKYALQKTDPRKYSSR